MANLITETIGGELYQYYPLGKHVVRAIGVCGGRPTFKFLRRIAASEFSRGFQPTGRSAEYSRVA